MAKSKKLLKQVCTLESDNMSRLKTIVRQNGLPRDVVRKLEQENKQFFLQVSNLTGASK